MRGEAESPGRLGAALEAVAFVGLVVSYIWWWKGSFHGHAVVVVGLYFAIGLETHLRRRESPRDLGLRRDTLGGAGILVLAWVGPLVLAAALAGLVLGTWRPPGDLLGSVAWHLAWGLLQQYGLLCVLFRRLEEIFTRDEVAILATGLLFGLFHFPNPFLSPLAVTLGILGAWIYSRRPNLPVMGAAHAVVGFVLTHALPVSLTWGLRVGPAVFRR